MQQHPIAPLAALLREEVLESLQANRRNAKATGREENSYPFIGLKRDWRASLYPNATDEEFADGFAQTVVFALGRVSYIRSQTRIAANTTPARYVTASLS